MRRTVFAGFAATAVIAATEARPQGATTLEARRRLEFDVPPFVRSDQARWVGDFDLALEEALRRNVPIVAVLSDDQSAGFKTVRESVYSQAGFPKFSRQCVLLAAFDGKAHPAKPRTVRGGEVPWCDLFDCPCDDHRSSFLRVRSAYATREYWNPLHVFVASDGVEVGRVESHLTTQRQLDDELARVRTTMRPSLDFEEYRVLLDRLRACVDQREKKGRGNVHDELGRMLAAETKAEKEGGARRVLKTAAMRKFVEELRASLVDEGQGLIEDADEMARARRFEEARKLLLHVRKSFRGLPPAAAAEKSLAGLPAPPPGRKEE